MTIRGIKVKKEVIGYIFFGVLTTLINFLVYAQLTILFNIDYKIAATVAWVIAFLFAFVTNKIYVFNSKSKNIFLLTRELGSFMLCRVFSYGLDIAAMVVMIELINVNDLAAKIIANGPVVVFNYLGSKFFVFRRLKEGGEKNNC